MRIAILAWRDLAHPNAGGSEVVVDRWARGLSDRGHEVTLVAGGPTEARDGYRVVRSGSTYSQYLRAPAFAAARLREHDLVIDVSNGIPYFAPVWRRRPVLGVVHHVHRQQWTDYYPRPVAAVGRMLEERLAPRVYRRTHVVGISASTCADIVALGADPANVHLVENGLDDHVLEAPETAPSDQPTFLALGRVATNKRPDLLLDMWERVRDQTGGRLVVAGGGPEVERLRARRVPGVEVTGRIDEQRKLELLGEAWMLVHAAPREGWGLVIMEAAARGRPTLAFDVEGVRDTVVDGETGVLVGDSSSFEAAWCRLATDHAERIRLGEAARRRAGDYTWTRTVDRLEVAALAAVEAA